MINSYILVNGKYNKKEKKNFLMFSGEAEIILEKELLVKVYVSATHLKLLLKKGNH